MAINTLMPFKGKIFNIGLPKTGTSSLHRAFEILGLKTIHNPLHWRKDVYEGNYRVCNNFDAITNFCEHTYPQFDKAYPDSKFIITVRDIDQWLKSWQKQIGDGIGNERLPRIITKSTWYQPGSWWWWLRTLNRMTGREPISHMHIRIEVFGTYQFVPERCRYVYQLHYRNALEYFKDRTHDLLVMDITRNDGWEKLCPFLGLPIPQEPFPWVLPHKSWDGAQTTDG